MEQVSRRVIAVTPMNPNLVTPRAVEIVKKWRGSPSAWLPSIDDSGLVHMIGSAGPMQPRLNSGQPAVAHGPSPGAPPVVT